MKYCRHYKSLQFMYVYICWRFSQLITENPVQGKSIWQNIPDFVIIPKTQFDQMIPT